MAKPNAKTCRWEIILDQQPTYSLLGRGSDDHGGLNTRDTNTVMRTRAT